MGLTIHYDITAPTSWTDKQLVDKLNESRIYAGSLARQAVSPWILHFKGPDNTSYANEEDENLRWLKIQACRHITNPTVPGRSRRDSPHQIFAYTAHLAPGCEPMNVGVNDYAPAVLPDLRGGHDGRSPAWSPIWEQVMTQQFEENKEPRKLMRAFMKQWSLRKAPPRKQRGEMRTASHPWPLWAYDPSLFSVALNKTGVPQVVAESGYDGHSGKWSVVFYCCEEMRGALLLRSTLSNIEARQMFQAPEFREALTQMACGREHHVDSERSWGSFVKTQYAMEPSAGGPENFLHAHTAVIRVLDHLKSCGFKVDVRDESGYWEHRNLQKLLESVCESRNMINEGYHALKELIGDDAELSTPLEN